MVHRKKHPNNNVILLNSQSTDDYLQRNRRLA